jgi:hypothetical protein
MSAAEDCPLCDDGIIVTVEYSWTGNPPERSGVPCWRCLTARAEKAERERDALIHAAQEVCDDVLGLACDPHAGKMGSPDYTYCFTCHEDWPCTGEDIRRSAEVLRTLIKDAP